jgi:hypothetical protein
MGLGQGDALAFASRADFFVLAASNVAMKITRTGSLTSTPSRRVGSRKAPATERFEDHVSAGEGAAAPAVSSVKSAPPVESVLAAQEVDDPGERPAKARRRAEDILDQLENVRHGLLAGAFSRRELESLARLVRIGRLQVDEPRLAEILDQIELRAEIELAKYSTLY